MALLPEGLPFSQFEPLIARIGQILSPLKAPKVLEIGPSPGQLSALFLRLIKLSPAEFVYFSYLGPGQDESGKPSKAPYSITAGPGERLPMEEKAMDIILSFYALESMRRDHLYMIFSEARRILKPGGRWIILHHAPPKPGFLLKLSRLWTRPSGPWLEIHHFISPEDWQIAAEERKETGGITAGLIVLEKI